LRGRVLSLRNLSLLLKQQLDLIIKAHYSLLFDFNTKDLCCRGAGVLFALYT